MCAADNTGNAFFQVCLCSLPTHGILVVVVCSADICSCRSVLNAMEHLSCSLTSAGLCTLLNALCMRIRHMFGQKNVCSGVQVVFDPAYYGLLGLRDATLMDQANVDVLALPGTVMMIP